MIDNDWVIRQINEMGENRYKANLFKAQERGQISVTKAGLIALDTAVERMKVGLDDWLKLQPHTPGPKKRFEKYLRLLPTEKISLITSQIIIDNLIISDAVQSCALVVANALEDELRITKFKKHFSEAWQNLQHKFKKTEKGRKHRIIKKTIRQLETADIEWPREEKFELGLFLMEFFAAVTGFAEIGAVKTTKKRARSVIRPTQELLDWMVDTNNKSVSKFPFYLPLVEPPLDWSSPREGGYPGDKVFLRWPLVHQYDRRAKALTHSDMPEVYSAVNSLQRVSWSINDFVYQVFDYFWKEQVTIADVPGERIKEIPPKPPEYYHSDDAKRRWKAVARAVYHANAELGSKKTLYAKIHLIASHFKDSPLYFPYKLDFRGRAYPIPAFLNPQGCSLAKGLLRFTNGKRIVSDEGRGWFFVHGANTWGNDKVTFDERIQWVQENEEKILAVYEDPISNTWWTKADSPWQFLAWCEEYGKYKEDPNILSYLPIAMDGTNNGLQIYSLLLRDPVGAAATNVSPADRPRDIYAEVADIVTQKLINETDPDKVDMARTWLAFTNGRIPRAATKRPVMVLPYGGTAFSIRQYVEDWYEAEIIKRELHMDRPFVSTYVHTRYLSQLILDAISGMLVGAVAGMNWLREIADIATDSQTPIVWRTPDGFEVFQACLNYSKVTIKTNLGRVHRRRTCRIPGLDLSRTGQANGLVPNFVHSLDKTIMVKTSNKLTEAGVHSFSMVHDSFATHAEDCPLQARLLREVVVEVFSKDLLEDFKNQIQKMLPHVVLPEPPEKGTLDISCVKESKYFFA